MGKINLKASINSDEENLNIQVSGIKTNNKIIYKENDKKVTILIFDNKIEMNRLCDDYEINLMFEEGIKTLSNYKVFGGSKIFNLETVTRKLNISDNKIYLEYELEGNSFKYTLEMEDL